MSTEKKHSKLGENQLTKSDSVVIKKRDSHTPVGIAPPVRIGGLDARTSVKVTDNIIEETGKETNLDHKNQPGLRPRNSKSSLEGAGRQRSLDLATSIQEKDDPVNKRGSPVKINHPPQDPQSPNAPQILDSERVTCISGSNPTSRGDLQKPDFGIGDAPLRSYYEPHGPGDTWTCPYNGCSRKIWGARDVVFIDLIKKHFMETHAGKMADLINQEIRPEMSIE